MSGTEESILGNIPDFQDEGGAGVDSSVDSGSGGSTDSSGGGRSSAQPTQTSSQPAQQDQRTNQPPIVRRHDGLLERQSAEDPRTRDLVDPVSGRIVARGGVERHVYEQSQRVQRENNQLKTRVSGLENALRSSNEVIQEAARLGVQPEDQKIAIRVMSDFMRDPVRTLEALVEEVKSKGYQIPFLTQGVTPGMDMNAFSRMIDAKLQPILQERQQNVQHAQAQAAARRDLDAFLEENQDANANLDVLSEMLQAQPGLPLQSAYIKMVRWSHENGLDWTQPLKPQIAALRQQQQPTQPQADSRPLPGRRSATTQGTQRMNGGNPQQFTENASWADIIRSAMEESGTRIN